MQRGGSFIEVADDAGRCTMPEGISVSLDVQDDQSPQGQNPSSILQRGLSAGNLAKTFAARNKGQQAVSFVEFAPDGRAQAATITVTGTSGRHESVVCESPTERFHIPAKGEQS